MLERTSTDACASNPSCAKCGLFSGCYSPHMAASLYSDKPAVLIIGEAPGKSEDENDEQFVGSSGSYLWNKLSGGEKHGFAVTNVVRCRPPNNKLTSKKPVKFCLEFLYDDIEHIDPDILLLLGKTPLSALTKHTKITEQRGTTGVCIVRGKEYRYVALLHPAAVLYDNNLDGTFTKDVDFFWSVLTGTTTDSEKIENSIVDASILNADAAEIERFAYESKIVAFDTETNTLKPYNIAWRDLRCYCLGLSNGNRQIVVRLDTLDRRMPSNSKKIEAIRKLFSDTSKTFVAHNAKYDMHILYRRFGIEVVGSVFDTVAMHGYAYPIRVDRGLKSLARQYVGVSGYEDAVDYDNIGSMEYLELSRYCAIDAHCCHKIFTTVLVEIDKQSGDDKKCNDKPDTIYSIAEYANQLQCQSTKTLWHIEKNGILFDAESASELRKQLDRDLLAANTSIRNLPEIQELRKDSIQALLNSDKKPKTEKSLNKAIERADDFNPASPPQVRAALFKYFNISEDNMPRTATGELATDEETLSMIIDSPHIVDAAKNFCKLVLDHRRLIKLRGTYVDGMSSRLSKDGRVRCKYNQAGADTGRLSSSDPNLQNIPRDSAIKNLFVAQRGYHLIECDYSQIELRILAIMSGDGAMMRIFKEGRDLHSETARTIFGLSDTVEPNKEQRARAKTVNFGVVYGQSPYGLSMELGIEQDEAERYINSFFTRFGGVHSWQEQIIEFAEKHGCVYTLFGMRRPIENARVRATSREAMKQKEHAFRQAVNTPIQGTASAITLFALNRLVSELRDTYGGIARVVNTVHDSIMIEARDDIVNDVLNHALFVTVDEAEKRLGSWRQDVPILVDAKIATKWGELADVAGATV